MPGQTSCSVSMNLLFLILLSLCILMILLNYPIFARDMPFMCWTVLRFPYPPEIFFCYPMAAAILSKHAPAILLIRMCCSARKSLMNPIKPRLIWRIFSRSPILQIWSSRQRNSLRFTYFKLQIHSNTILSLWRTNIIRGFPDTAFFLKTSLLTYWLKSEEPICR